MTMFVLDGTCDANKGRLIDEESTDVGDQDGGFNPTLRVRFGHPKVLKGCIIHARGQLFAGGQIKLHSIDGCS